MNEQSPNEDQDHAKPVQLLTFEDFGPVYAVVQCPDAGRLSVFNYISAGAFAGYSGTENAISRLNALLDESFEGNVPSELTESDKGVLCRHFASCSEFLPDYDRYRETHDVATAFWMGMEASEIWADHCRSQRQLERIVERQQERMDQLTKTVFPIEALTRSLSPAIKLNLLPRFESTLSNTVNNVFTETTRRMIEASQPRIAEQIELLNSRMFTSMQARIDAITRSATNALRISSTFHELRQEIQQRKIADRDLLESVDVEIHSANQQVAEASELFAADVAEKPVPDEKQQANEIILQNDTTLVIAEGSSLTEIIQWSVTSAIKDEFAPFKNILQRLNYLAAPQSFAEMLNEFSKTLSRDYWQMLWATPGDEWKPGPESIVQALLGMYLAQTWRGVGFVGRELCNGDGFVDLFVHFLKATYVVELKIVGAGWGIGAAESGVDQLRDYMKNFPECEAYLIVFDGRKTDRGRQLPPTIPTDAGTIHVVNVRVYFEAPSRRRP